MVANQWRLGTQCWAGRAVEWLLPRSAFFFHRAPALAEGGRDSLATDLLIHLFIFIWKKRLSCLLEASGRLGWALISPVSFLGWLIFIHPSVHPFITGIYHSGFCLHIPPGKWGTRPNSAECYALDETQAGLQTLQWLVARVSV